MTKKSLKIYHERKVDETAEKPLLNPEAEKQRLDSIEEQKKKQEEFRKREENLKKFFLRILHKKEE